MQNDELDELLQAGLKSYTQAEPQLGLEERVLGRVQTRAANRRWIWLGGAGATACACLLLAVVLGHQASYRPPGQPLAQRVGGTIGGASPGTEMRRSTPEKSSMMAASGLEPHIAGVRGVAKLTTAVPEKLPKLDIFPTPSPMTPEERALVEFANQHPKEAELIIEQERQSSGPIQIAAIHIEPLTMDGPQQKEETNAQDQ